MYIQTKHQVEIYCNFWYDFWYVILHCIGSVHLLHMMLTEYALLVMETQQANQREKDQQKNMKSYLKNAGKILQFTYTETCNRISEKYPIWQYIYMTYIVASEWMKRLYLSSIGFQDMLYTCQKRTNIYFVSNHHEAWWLNFPEIKTSCTFDQSCIFGRTCTVSPLYWW